MDKRQLRKLKKELIKKFQNQWKNILPDAKFMKAGDTLEIHYNVTVEYKEILK